MNTHTQQEYNVTRVALYKLQTWPKTPHSNKLTSLYFGYVFRVHSSDQTEQRPGLRASGTQLQLQRHMVHKGLINVECVQEREKKSRVIRITQSKIRCTTRLGLSTHGIYVFRRICPSHRGTTAGISSKHVLKTID